MHFFVPISSLIAREICSIDQAKLVETTSITPQISTAQLRDILDDPAAIGRQLQSQ